MKKLIISATVAAALGLSGCGGEDTLNDVRNEANQDPAKPFARIVFDPAASELNIPNDLLMIPDGSFFDFTLNTEGDATFDPSNPQHALSALDGWSTHHPFQIRVTMPEGVSLDSQSAGAGAIRLYEATQALEGDSATCQAIAAEAAAPGLPCELGEELTWGVDFITQVSDAEGGTISVVPLKPLKAAQGYMLVVTDELKDSEGRSVRGSNSWELARQNPETNPLGSDDQKQLQNILNFFMTLLGGEGFAREEVSYAAYFSTQSAGTVLSTVKQLQIGQFAQAFGAALAGGADQAAAMQAAAQFLPAIPVSEAAVPDAFSAVAPGVLGAETWAQLGALGLDSCAGLAAGMSDPNPQIAGTAQQVFGQLGAFCAASMKQGSITLPYYLSTTNPQGDWWRAACTNGAMLQALGQEQVASLIAQGQVGDNNLFCQQASQGQLVDLDLSVLGMDDPRHLTKVNPIPQAQSEQNIEVQITVPDPSYANMINAQLGQPAITKPDSGWPVVILQHGITSKKQDMLAVTGALSLAGFATVAIDHPLHASRGFEIDGQPVNASNGFGGSATDYLNLSSLLTARDNVRQSIADIMGLRLGLNAVVDTTGGTVDLDGSNVSFMGHSLGAITGTAAVALANNSLGGDLANFDSMYAMNAATLANPGGGIAGFLLESPAFAPLIKASLLSQALPEFQQALQQYMQANGIAEVTPELLTAFYPVFESQLSAEQLAEANATFSSFTFAAQTVIDAGDPNNYAAMLGASTPVHMLLVVGDGGEMNLPDQVVPVETSLPLSGGKPLAQQMGLPAVNSTAQGSGVVSFLEGTHSSILDPGPSAAATAEMQRQLATFMATMGTTILVTDTSVVAQ